MKNSCWCGQSHRYLMIKSYSGCFLVLVKFITVAQTTKPACVTTTYNQYLIRNYFTKEIKNANEASSHLLYQEFTNKRWQNAKVQKQVGKC